ncbi:MAG: XrtA system polysaccharide deacetylase, partial [Candidatus Zixiibacteriota bacterium]
MITNVMTVDLKEWFVVEIFADRLHPMAWDRLPTRVEDNTYKLIELLESRHVSATFFVLGWVADRFPKLIRDIADAGHEIGCHSYWHRRVDSLNREQFREDTRRAIGAIEKACGVRPRGYRAPGWSISSRNIWALNVLAELGFVYDSSIFPVKHDVYGDLTAPRRLVKLDTGDRETIFELPASSVRLLGRNVPIAGGGYLRHSPYWYSSRMIRRLNNEGLPAVVYVRPWEFDIGQPVVDGIGLRDHFRQYASLSSFKRKFERLLDDFEFSTAARLVENSQ